jgi:hypothetical protein
MFVLFDFSTPACVPQNPGVRQIVAPQPGGVGFAGTEWHCPLTGSQTSVVQRSVSCVHDVVGPDAHLPVAGTHDSTVHRLLSCAQVRRAPDSQFPVVGLHDSTVHRSSSCVHVFIEPDSQRPVDGLQLSVVHRFPSCAHVIGVNSHCPDVGLHEPTEQRLSDVHVFDGPDEQAPVAGLHVSAVQRLPSCAHVIGWYTHWPVVGLHDPSEHLLSSGVGHVTGEPDWQVPVLGLHVSVEQRLPSCAHVTGWYTHWPFDGSHDPTEHLLSSGEGHDFGV